MGAQERVVTEAKKWDGYLEKASNSQLDSFTANAGSNNFTIFAKHLYETAPNLLNGNKNGYQWCTSYYLDIFVRCFGAERTQKALYLPSKSLAAGCIYAVNYYKAVGKYDQTPEIGAQVFFSDSDGDPCHTGMVIGYDNTYVYTIEGNTSGASGVVSNGGGVARKSYRRNYSRIHGYGHPDWAYLDQAYSEGWQKTDGRWWYRYTDGSYPVSEWKEIDGYWYYFDDEGYIVTDKTWTYNGITYTADSDGHITSTKATTSGTVTAGTSQQTTTQTQSTKVFGIDISAWQGSFDFAKAAKNEGVKFVVLKAGGADDGYYIDSKFETNYKNAKAAGLYVGAYFFSKALNVEAAKKEAQYFYTNCLKGKQFELPVYLDVENKTQLAIGKTALTAVVKTWCETIKSYGYLPGVYSSLSYFSSYMNDSELKVYEHWVAQWSTSCQYSGAGMWQFGGETNYIRSNQINGQTVDQDYMLIDYPTKVKTEGWNGYSKQEYTEGWQKSDDKWWYRYKDGTWPASQWAMIDNKWYYFNEEGYMVTDQWQTANGKCYYLGSDGAMVVNKSIKINEKGELVPACNFFHQVKDITYSSYKSTVDKLIEKGILKGTSGTGDDRVIDLSEEAIRTFVIMDRAGMFDK